MNLPTSEELELMKETSGRALKLRAILDIAPVVYTCRINQAFTSTDKIAQFTFDGGSGTAADVLFGMTVLFGSSEYGYDIGMSYVRKSISGTTFYFGESSDLQLSDNLYVTVVDEFSIWTRHIRILDDGSVRMDYDVAYSDQNTNLYAIPNIGCDRVVKLETDSVEVVFSESSVFGNAVASRLWACPEAASVSGETSSEATFTFDAVGRYRISYQTTTSAGKVLTVYRYVFVWGSSSDFVFEISGGSISADSSGGGWSGSISIDTEIPYSGGSGLVVRDRTKCILFYEDLTGDGKLSMGPYAGMENILFSGWVFGESFSFDAETQQTSFQVQSLIKWLNEIKEYPVGIRHTSSTSTRWEEIKDLTVDKALYQIWLWRTTAWLSADLTPTGDTKRNNKAKSGFASILSQIKIVINKTLLHTFRVNRFGMCFCEPEFVSYIPSSDRGDVPEVMELHKDYFTSLSIEKTIVPTTSQLTLSGVVVTGDSDGEAYFALAPGHVPGRFGNSLSIDKLLLSTQAATNELCGNIYAHQNRKFNFDFEGVSFIPFLDIAPLQKIALNIAETDNNRRIEFSGHFQPLQLSITLDPTSLAPSMSVSGCEIVLGTQGITGDVPITNEAGTVTRTWSPSRYNPVPLQIASLALPTFPESTSGLPSKCLLLTNNLGLWYTDSFDQDYPRWRSLNANLTAAELAQCSQLKLNNYGRYYFKTTYKIWSGLVGEAATAYDTSLFESLSASYQISSLACNPTVSDSVMAVLNTNVYPPEGILCLGNSGGFSEKSTLSGTLWGPSGISYCAGKWLVTYPGDVVVTFYSARYSADGGTEEFVGTGGTGSLDSNGYANPGALQRVSGPTQNGNVRFLGYQDSTRNTILDSTGEVETLLTSIQFNEIGGDETGVYLMAPDLINNSLPRKSNDGGVTWGTINTGGGYTEKWIGPVGCLNKDTFVWATRYFEVPILIPPMVRLTTDFGASWYDKTGDLLTYLGDNILGSTIMVLA